MLRPKIVCSAVCVHGLFEGRGACADYLLLLHPAWPSSVAHERADLYNGFGGPGGHRQCASMLPVCKGAHRITPCGDVFKKLCPMRTPRVARTALVTQTHDALFFRFR